MNRTFRKYGKQIMAVLGVLLMIAFALPSACSSNYRRADTALGTLRNGKEALTAREYNTYTQQWQYLKRNLGPAVISAVLGGLSEIGDDDLVLVLGTRQIASEMNQMVSLRGGNPMAYPGLIP